MEDIMREAAIAPQGGVLLPPTKETIEQKFDLSIALALSQWSALTLSVQNSWGGPESSEKRDWFAGAISELFESEKDNIDVDYLEEFMLNIMNDEFDVNIDDESGGEVAAKIIGLRKKTLEGDFRLVNEMLEKWQEKQRKGGDNIKAQFTQGQDNEDESDYDSDETDGDDDMDMDDAPSLPSAPKEKPLPEVDEDGFTKVVGKKKK